MPEHTTHQFKGYASPNYTPVPDELFDEQLPDLSGAELKVLLYVIRRTFGFKRESDNISISQMLNGLHTYDGRQLDRGVVLPHSRCIEIAASPVAATAPSVGTDAWGRIASHARWSIQERGNEPLGIIEIAGEPVEWG